MRRFNLFMLPRHLAALRAMAKKTGLSVSDLIRMAVEKLLKEGLSL